MGNLQSNSQPRVNLKQAGQNAPSNGTYIDAQNFQRSQIKKVLKIGIKLGWKGELLAVQGQSNLNLVDLHLNATNIARNTLFYFNVRFPCKSGVLVMFLFRLIWKFRSKNHKNVDKIWCRTNFKNLWALNVLCSTGFYWVIGKVQYSSWVCASLCSRVWKSFVLRGFQSIWSLQNIFHSLPVSLFF